MAGGQSDSNQKEIKKVPDKQQKFLDALDAIEKDNPKLKGVLNKSYGRLQIDQSKLIELINLISEIPFAHESLQAKDILGHVYEYFLGQFALAEGKKGGQFYTPKSIVSLIVEMLHPFQGRVYDPAMGSGVFLCRASGSSRNMAAGSAMSQFTARSTTTPPGSWPL